MKTLEDAMQNVISMKKETSTRNIKEKSSKPTMILAPKTSIATTTPIKTLSERCDAIFNTMEGRYSQKWIKSLNGSENSYINIRKTWMSAIHPFSMTIIEKAMGSLWRNDKYDTFPPTPMVFQKMCILETKKIKDEHEMKERLSIDYKQAIPMPDNIRSEIDLLLKNKKSA